MYGTSNPGQGKPYSDKNIKPADFRVANAVVVYGKYKDNTNKNILIEDIGFEPNLVVFTVTNTANVPRYFRVYSYWTPVKEDARNACKDPKALLSP